MSPGHTEEIRECARRLFLDALNAASVEGAFERHVQCDRGVLRICDDLYDLNRYSHLFVVSFGKAAHSMLAALQKQAGDRFEGIVSSSVQPEFQVRGFRYFNSGHPTPNAESIRAAEAALRSLHLHSQNASTLVIYLVSGGGSSMLEKPLDNEISLDDLISAYRALVLSGCPIAAINAIRKHLSAVKGGRLAQAAAPAQQVSLLISDVPDSTPDALASGPTMPDSTIVEDCYAVAVKYGLLAQFPQSVRELFECRALEETPKSDDPAFSRSRWWTLLSNQALLARCAEEAVRQGFLVEIDNGCDDWDYQAAAEYLVGKLHELRKKSERACLISGGEVTVKVVNGGIGGRNQQFALACAKLIEGQRIVVLSAGSDGIDGNSPAAGALADGSTLKRADAQGMSAQKHLAAFDTYHFFHSLRDDIVTGPTGNNLRDLRILLSY